MGGWQNGQSSPSDPAPFPLTKCQADLCAFIKGYAARNGGQAPSFDEMAAGLGPKSKSGVHHLIEALAERNGIRRLRGRARAIAVCVAEAPKPHSIFVRTVPHAAVEALVARLVASGVADAPRVEG